MELTASRSRSWSLWIFISWLCLFSSGVFGRWFHIGTQAERDQPAIASPRSRSADPPGFDGFNPLAQIYCVGEFPQTTIPSNFYPNHRGSSFVSYRDIYANLRELCARPVYGGSITAFSAGGYCAAGVNPPTVVFQDAPPEGNAMSEKMKSIYLHCQSQCRCVTGSFSDLRTQGRPATQIPGNEEFDPTIFYDERLSAETVRETLANNRINDPIPDRARLSYGYPPPVAPGVELIPVYFIREKYGRLLGSGSGTGGVIAVNTLWVPPFDGDTAPVCKGSITSSDNRPLGETRDKCPAAWFGGSKNGNVGLVCKKDESIMDPHLTIERAVSHPIYQNVVRNTGPPSDPKTILNACYSQCDCPKPKKKTALENQIAATNKLFQNVWNKNYMNGPGGGAGTNTPKSPDSQQYSPGSAYKPPGYKPLNSGGYTLAGTPVSLEKTCSVNTVEGFGLSYSLAKQKICQQRLANLAFLSSGG